MNRFTSERFNSGESLVNFSHLEKIQTFKKFCSGEYLSHLQKIQFFRRFDCGESLEYFSHLQRFRHSKDSTTRKYNFKFRTEFEYNLSTSRHFNSPPLCLPHFTPLHATSLCLVLSASLRATSRHLTPPVIFTSLHATSRHLLFCLPHFIPLHATSRHLPFFLPHFMPLHSNSLHFEIIFTFAKDSDIRKIRIGESFEY